MSAALGADCQIACLAADCVVNRYKRAEFSSNQLSNSLPGVLYKAELQMSVNSIVTVPFNGL